MKRRLSAQAAGHAGRSLRASVRCICRRPLSSAAAAKGKFVPPVIPEVDVKEKELVKAAKKSIRDYEYHAVLTELQAELTVLQESIKASGQRIVVLFEGRDAAGKGGCITRIVDAMSPRVCHVVALGTPTPREKSQWYFQRYVQHLPTAGEIVLFDRSWYNRAGVERVMGFCTDAEYEEFMRSVPLFEEMLVNSGVQLIKLWFDVSNEEQEARFQSRLDVPCASPRGPGPPLTRTRLTCRALGCAGTSVGS